MPKYPNKVNFKTVIIVYKIKIQKKTLLLWRVSLIERFWVLKLTKYRLTSKNFYLNQVPTTS